MPRTFEIRPYDDNCERILYKKPRFTFQPGVTMLLGCNRSGKTTLLRRMADVLRAEGVCVVEIMKQQMDNDMSWLSSGGSLEALSIQVSRGTTSEGEYAKLVLSGLLPKVGQAMRSGAKEIWLLLDGLDTSLSEDQLDDISGLFDAIVETAPKDAELYLVATTNQFTLAKGRRAIRVGDARELTVKSFGAYRNCILQSAKARNAAKEVTESQWERRYKDMTDSSTRQP